MTPAFVSFSGIFATILSVTGSIAAESASNSQAEGIIPVTMLVTGMCVTATLVWKVATQKHTVDLNIKDIESRIRNIEKQIERDSKKD